MKEQNSIDTTKRTIFHLTLKIFRGIYLAAPKELLIKNRKTFFIKIAFGILYMKQSYFSLF